MKILKFIFIFIFTVLLISYLSFLFIIPKFIDTKTIEKYSGLNSTDYSFLSYDDIKFFTTYNLQAGLKFKNLKITTDNKNELVSLSNAEISIKILPLLLKKIKLGKVNLDNLILNIIVTKDKKILLDKILTDKLSGEDNSPFKLSSILPEIKLSDYHINIIDEKTKEKFNINGKQTKISGNLDKNIIVKTDGNIKFNKNNLVNFNIKCDYEFPKKDKNQNIKLDTFDIDIEPFLNIAKYNFKSNINGDLKISQKKDDTYYKGYINIDGISFKINGTQIPNSYIHAQFNKKKIILNSDFYLNKKDKISVNGDIKTGKKAETNLNFKALNINLQNIQAVAEVILSVLNKDNPLKDCAVTGILNSDFQFATDMKTIKSKGELTVKSVEIKHKLLPFKIDKTNAKINFANNKINIENATAYINDSLIKINGSVDSTANANIHLFSDNLPIAQIYKAFAPNKTKNLFLINKGILNFNVFIKGKLDKIAPEITAELKNLSVKDNSLKFIYDIEKISADIKSNGKDFTGDIILNDATITSCASNLKLKILKAILDITPDLIIIKPFSVSLNSQTSTIKGQIQNYQKNAEYNISAKGGVKTTDILSFIPKEYKNFFVSKGVLEYILTLKGNTEKTDIQAQILSTPNNYLSALDINTLKGKNSLTDAEIEFTDNKLKISNISLNQYNGNSLSENLKNNTSNCTKILYLNGEVTNVFSQKPYINDLKINLVKPLTAGITGYKNSTATLKGNLSLTGYISNPLILGDLLITNLSVPDFSLKSGNINVLLNKNNIKINSPNINIANSSAGFDLEADSEFKKLFNIRKININATSINMDELLNLANNLPEAQFAPGSDLPVKINQGKITAKQVKLGEFLLTNANSDLTLTKNILTLKNFLAETCKGIVKGDITYNFSYMWLNADLKGNSMSANRVLTALFNLENQVIGALSFDTKVSFSGLTLNEQIKTLAGYTNFTVNDGQMGALGQFEHFINAQNLLTASLISKSVMSMVKLLTPQNTGKFETLKGQLTYKNGYANLSSITLRGPQMAFIIDGNLNMLNNNADMTVLGRISQDVVNSVKPLANMSLDKLSENAPTLGNTISTLFSVFNVTLPNSDINRIPTLTKTSSGKLFKVVILGNIEKISAVKSFKWVNSETETTKAQEKIQKSLGTVKVQLNNQTNALKNTVKKGIQPLVSTPAHEGNTIPQNIKNNLTEKLNEAGNKVNKQFLDLMNALPD